MSSFYFLLIDTSTVSEPANAKLVVAVDQMASHRPFVQFDTVLIEGQFLVPVVVTYDLDRSADEPVRQAEAVELDLQGVLFGQTDRLESKRRAAVQAAQVLGKTKVERSVRQRDFPHAPQSYHGNVGEVCR